MRTVFCAMRSWIGWRWAGALAPLRLAQSSTRQWGDPQVPQGITANAAPSFQDPSSRSTPEIRAVCRALRGWHRPGNGSNLSILGEIPAVVEAFSTCCVAFGGGDLWSETTFEGY